MTFLRPEAWPLLLLAPLLFAVLWMRDRRRRARTEAWLGPRAGRLAVHASPRRRHFKRTLEATAALLAIGALLEPVWGAPERRREPKGADLVVCLDVSRSMLAIDLDPNRLVAARRAVAKLVDTARGDRFGLVLFAGQARFAVPLTSDGTSFCEFVDAAGPLSVGTGGTDLGAALEAALGALDGATGEHAAILLLTDGEDHGGDAAEWAAECARRGIPVHAVGFGTSDGAKIAVPQPDGSEAFLRNREGREVVTALDPTSLKRIAAAGEGAYADAAEDGDDVLARLYEDEIVPRARRAFEEKEDLVRPPRFAWLLLPAFLLCVLNLALTDRRGGRPARVIGA